MSLETQAVETPPPRYWAFISHSHRDKRQVWWFFERRWGSELHRRLERYRIPRSLVGKQTPMGPVPRRIFPVFLDAEELPSSPDLSQSIQIALRECRTLVVICSPHAAQSRWVNEEVRQFKSLNERPRILGLIVAGRPHANDAPMEECFPEALRYEVDPAGTILRSRLVEPIAADVRPGETSLHNATLKLVAGIVGLRYDELRQRDRWRWWWEFILKLVLVGTVLGIAWEIAESARRRARQESSSFHEWRIKEQNLPFPRMFGRYSNLEIETLGQRRSATEELVQQQAARVEYGVGLPADTERLAHDLALIDAELAWARGEFRDAERHLQRAVQHVERQAEIASLRHELGVDRMDGVLLVNDRRDQTRLALVRLQQVIADLRSQGMLDNASR